MIIFEISTYYILIVLTLPELRAQEGNQNCQTSLYGCCPDGKTPADSPSMENCRIASESEPCESTEYGCCSDDVTAAKGPFKEGCIDLSCRESANGCCEDGVTPAKLLDKSDCPQNCLHSLYGCCPDGKTAAKGIGHAGCIYTSTTSTSGSNNCAQSEFGCCDDGVTIARGPDRENCPDYVIDLNEPMNESGNLMDESENEKSQSLQPPEHLEQKVVKLSEPKPATYNSSFDCSKTKFECCPDGQTPANGPGFKDCPADSSRLEIKYAPNPEAICLLPEPNKNCYNYSLKWRYDSDEGRCVQFWYGGCDPNENLFGSNEECEARCVNPKGTEVCSLPLVNPIKVCRQNITRYYYDSSTASCKQFAYTGCLGNGNNFETLDECEKKCKIQLLFEECSFIPDKGPCRGEFSRWYYDSKVGVCRTFKYGGCLKNKNNHFTEIDCIGSCIKPKQKNVCLLPKITGSCDEKINSWYFDFTEGKCKELVYSGCNGNLNRFETRDACEYTCQGLDAIEQRKQILSDVCNAPKLTGMCNLNLQRWYFNKTTSMCHQFTYSGCDGSANNFESELECRTTCSAKEIDPCVLPMDHGTCDKYKIYWYFNRVDRECVRFYYGGCDGNQNRFESRENCEMQCKLSQEEKAALMKLPVRCLATMEYGNNCGEIQPRWYFDTQNKLCYPFEYSGCGPENSNRFETIEECNKTCTDQLYSSSNASSISSNGTQAGSGTETINKPMQSVEHVTKTTTSQPVDICSLPMEKGNCSQIAKKWFYDHKGKYCRQFNFTGCNGNENRFETRHQCTEICESPKRREICNSYKVQGPCSDFQTKWYYDIDTKSCREFIYGGCLGNENNFETQIECRNICWDYLSEESRFSVTNTNKSSISATTTIKIETTTVTHDVCSLKKSEGNVCTNSSSTERWYFDSVANECKRFTFKGCGGNENNFESREKCQLKCTQNFLDTSFINYESPCESPSDISIDCLNEYTLEILQSKQDETLDSLIWYYDIEVRSCRPIAGECIHQNNPNRFSTRDACKAQCLPNVTDKVSQDDCLLPMEVGSKCNQQLWKWYYDSKAGDCYMFSYSGCQGNNNNFATSRMCLHLCASVGGHACPSLSSCTLECKHGRVVSLNGCELCECNDPCENIKCEPNQMCVLANGVPTCRQKNKTGSCPNKQLIEDKSCNSSSCLTDADCSLDLKCCLNSCSSLRCVPPIFDSDPKIEDFKNQYEVSKGDRLELPCKVSGSPTPIVTWFKNHREISFDPFDSRVTLSATNFSLLISSVLEKDEGIYSCRASSRSGKAVVKETNVIVYAPLSAQTTYYEKYDLLGNDVVLFCNISGRPVPTYEWFFEKNKLKSDPFKYTIYPGMLLVKRLEYSDVGNYSCSATSVAHEKQGGKPIVIRINLKRAIPGEIKFSFTQVYGDVNQSIVLHCNHTGVPRPNISWLAPPYKEIIQNSAKYSIVNGTDLKIHNLQFNDSGIYRCSALNEFSYNFQKKKYGSILLNVFARPSILNKPKKIYAYEESTHTLNCVVSGMPKPELTWHFDDKLLVKNQLLVLNASSVKYTYTPKNGSLTISNVKPEDSGVYYCSASSIEKFPPAKINYTIQVINEKLFINQTHNITVNELETIRADCKIPNYERILNLAWSFNDTHKLANLNSDVDSTQPARFHFENDNRTLVISRPQAESDSGTYECFAETTLYNYITRVNVVILGKQPVESRAKNVRVEKGRMVTLDCAWWFNANSNDQSLLFNTNSVNSTEWLLNGSRLDVDAAPSKYKYLDTLNTLLSVSVSSIGEANDVYNCTLKFKNGTVRLSNFTLDVGVRPFVNEEMIELNQTNKWYEKSDTVYLECPIEGQPAPLKTWLFNSVVIDNQTSSASSKYVIDSADGSLRIDDFDVSQQGIYSCNGSNEFGMEVFSYKLELAYPMYIIEPSIKTFKAKKHETVVLKCEYRGGKPEPVASWLFNGQLLNTIGNEKYSSELSSLKIKNAMKSDNGVYTCLLSNGYHPQQSLNLSLVIIDALDSVTIKFVPENPLFSVGADGRLVCTVEHSNSVNEIAWFKNGIKIENSTKYKISGGNLTIINVAQSDGGRYSCRVSNNESHTTKSIHVKTTENNTKSSECQDKSSHTDCKLVVSKGLCQRWGQFCCKTCRQAGFDVKFTKMRRRF